MQRQLAVQFEGDQISWEPLADLDLRVEARLPAGFGDDDDPRRVCHRRGAGSLEYFITVIVVGDRQKCQDHSAGRPDLPVGSDQRGRDVLGCGVVEFDDHGFLLYGLRQALPSRASISTALAGPQVPAG